MHATHSVTSKLFAYVMMVILCLLCDWLHILLNAVTNEASYRLCYLGVILWVLTHCHSSMYASMGVNELSLSLHGYNSVSVIPWVALWVSSLHHGCHSMDVTMGVTFSCVSLCVTEHYSMGVTLSITP